MGNISVIKTGHRLSHVTSKPRLSQEIFTNANTDIIFNIQRNDVDDGNVALLVIVFELRYFHVGTPDRLGIALEFTGRFQDPDHKLKTDLFAEESILVLASIYKHCGELLIAELVKERPEVVGAIPESDREIDKETAIANTRQIMAAYKLYLATLN